MNGIVPRPALVFRGWANEAEDVVKALTAAGIPSESVETLVPAIIGGNLLVCEVFVQQTYLARAHRTVEPIVRARKRI